ncbi:hypothetical protein WJS89_06630 [Sphingomicrobium sp. XHP0235]|uniref:hypothetical protein n=1 Tax=Sphingomicrobium aquimarinum TaxID=3133971 RepID=UPI0031FE97EF
MIVRCGLPSRRLRPRLSFALAGRGASGLDIEARTLAANQFNVDATILELGFLRTVRALIERTQTDRRKQGNQDDDSGGNQSAHDKTSLFRTI